MISADHVAQHDLTYDANNVYLVLDPGRDHPVLATASAEMTWRNGFSLGATFEGEFSNVTRSFAGKGIVRYVW